MLYNYSPVTGGPSTLKVLPEVRRARYYCYGYVEEWVVWDGGVIVGGSRRYDEARDRPIENVPMSLDC